MVIRRRSSAQQSISQGDLTVAELVVVPELRTRTQLYFWSVIVPADGTGAANVGTGDFGRSPIFVQLADKLVLACA